MTVLSKPPQKRQGPDPRPLRLLVGIPSAPWTRACLPTERSYSIAYSSGCHYVFAIFFITKNVCVWNLYDLSAWVGCWSSVF